MLHGYSHDVVLASVPVDDPFRKHENKEKACSCISSPCIVNYKEKCKINIFGRTRQRLDLYFIVCIFSVCFTFYSTRQT